MKPHQPTLIKWFAKYKISLTQAEQEEKRPDFPVLRDESVSFDPNAIENPNQNLISEDADSLDSSSDDEKIKFEINISFCRLPKWAILFLTWSETKIILFELLFNFSF